MSVDKETFDEMAVVYDEMIDWDKRIKRELPFLREIFRGKEKLLDLACATGRHALALSEEFEITAIDINPEMIKQAKKLVEDINDRIEFICGDVSELNKDDGPFDGGYILANSLANLNDRQKIIDLLNKLRILIPEGILVGQTVYLDKEINYLPLRYATIDTNEYIIQRIMIPNPHSDGTKRTHDLHFNILSSKEGETDKDYRSRTVIPLFGLSPDKLEEIVAETDWKIREMYGSYDKKPVESKTGSAQIWVLE